MVAYVVFIDTSHKKHIATQSFKASTSKAVEAAIQKFITDHESKGYKYKVYYKSN